MRSYRCNLSTLARPLRPPGTRRLSYAHGFVATSPCSVRSWNRVARSADVPSHLVGRFGRLDIMFNRVGVPTPRPGSLLEDHTVEDFDRLVAINLRGVFLGCKHAVLQFK